MTRETELLELIRIAGGSETNDLLDVFWSSHAEYVEHRDQIFEKKNNFDEGE